MRSLLIVTITARNTLRRVDVGLLTAVNRESQVSLPCLGDLADERSDRLEGSVVDHFDGTVSLDCRLSVRRSLCCCRVQEPGQRGLALRPRRVQRRPADAPMKYQQDGDQWPLNRPSRSSAASLSIFVRPASVAKLTVASATNTVSPCNGMPSGGPMTTDPVSASRVR